MWEIANGTEGCPTVEKEAAKWKRKDQKALATIVLGVKPTQLNAINNCETANEAWKKLKEIHEPKGPARKYTCLKDYST